MEIEFLKGLNPFSKSKSKKEVKKNGLENKEGKGRLISASRFAAASRKKTAFCSEQNNGGKGITNATG